MKLSSSSSGFHHPSLAIMGTGVCVKPQRDHLKDSLKPGDCQSSSKSHCLTSYEPGMSEDFGSFIPSAVAPKHLMCEIIRKIKRVLFFFFVKSSEAVSLQPVPAQAPCSSCQKVQASQEAPPASHSQLPTPVLQLGLSQQVLLRRKTRWGSTST